MPEMKQYEPGMFCWFELATGDSKAAREFYSKLFGWSANEIPMGDKGTYVMLLKGGKDVGALYENKQVPSHWLSYIAVASADRSAEKAKSEGGNVLAPPFDVMDVGRMAVVQDPQGATFALWEAGRHIGATLRDETGSVCWNELLTSDVASARAFYERLFGWKLKLSHEYTEAHVGGHAVAGLMQMPSDMQGVPPNWTPYFAVENCDAAVAKAKSLGGAIYVPPTDIPTVGRFAVVADPQGATFSVIKLSDPSS